MMKLQVLLLFAGVFSAFRAWSADALPRDVRSLVKASCVHCHDAETKTKLNLESLKFDLADAKTFARWERVFDRVRTGEMPPNSEQPPDAKTKKSALAALEKSLRAASLSKQKRVGRVPARRLTRTELGYTFRDLLFIEDDVTGGIPAEVESGSFDTVGATQRISAVHLKSYLKAADDAIAAATKLGKNPFSSRTNNNAWLEAWHNKPLNQGGSITRKLKDGFALFADIDYLTRFQFKVRTAGRHRITIRVAAIQSKVPVTIKVIVKEPGGGARLVKSQDIKPGPPQTIAFETWLQPGDSPYLTFHSGMNLAQSFTAIGFAGGAKTYPGKGIAISEQKIEGPLTDAWPPKSTRELLRGVTMTTRFGRASMQFSKEPMQHIREIVEHLGPRAFRRPLRKGELEAFVALAGPALKSGRDFRESLQISLRSMLSSPQFLMFDSRPGRLDDYALANRLSFFLWKSLPDDELFALAKAGKLSQPKVLSAQVDRMLRDKRSSRFVSDFLGQWLRLNKINATTPDEKLYPEYDELLGTALRTEPEMFFSELIRSNLSVTNLVDSKFTFLNRRLAEHYKIAGVAGQHFRKVTLPANTRRGGILTQAAILKTTANGTVTSPVLRGNFVLTNLLGTPPSPPPPNIGSIEPDTRGKTTIREILKAHRDIKTCAKCHREIDPPGFALESFDPIGGFRSNYRATTGTTFVFGKTYKKGPAVDAGGITSDGKKFAGIKEFKRLLLREKEQIARNVISKLVVYSTGGEIQFADRDEIRAILEKTRADDFRLRDIIHAVVQSRLFRHQ